MHPIITVMSLHPQQQDLKRLWKQTIPPTLFWLYIYFRCCKPSVETYLPNRQFNWRCKLSPVKDGRIYRIGRSFRGVKTLIIEIVCHISLGGESLSHSITRVKSTVELLWRHIGLLRSPHVKYRLIYQFPSHKLLTAFSRQRCHHACIHSGYIFAGNKWGTLLWPAHLNVCAACSLCLQRADIYSAFHIPEYC